MSTPFEPDDDAAYRAVLSERLRKLKPMLNKAMDERGRLDQTIASYLGEIGNLEGILCRDPSSAPASADGRRRATPDDVVHLVEQVGRPLHYRAIEAQLKKQGLNTGGGSDPANALLARYSRDPRLRRFSKGTYGLAGWTTES